MTANKDRAAAMLAGHTLPNGWKVVSKIEQGDDHTGGFFSVPYVVEKGDQKGFLKAFDFSRAFDQDDFASALQKLTTAFTYERDLLAFCNDKKLRKVVIALDHGQFQVPDYAKMEGSVPYLVFELADGDVRGQVRADQRFNTVWCLTALHDVATGLFQIHSQMIAHQDVKPSNVLIFNAPGKQECRIGDLGRASRKGHPAVHDEYYCAGALTYSPPELLYGYRDPDFAAQRIGCDMYMFGNLAAFLLTGINVTDSIFSYLDEQHHPINWGGRYLEVLPYVTSAFAHVIRDIRRAVDPLVTDEIVVMILQLCDPDPTKRGEPRRIGRPDQYSLQRVISLLDRCSKAAAIRQRAKLRA